MDIIRQTLDNAIENARAEFAKSASALDRADYTLRLIEEAIDAYEAKQNEPKKLQTLFPQGQPREAKEHAGKPDERRHPHVDASAERSGVRWPASDR